jgi:hypothetical protein
MSSVADRTDGLAYGIGDEMCNLTDSDGDGCVSADDEISDDGIPKRDMSERPMENLTMPGAPPRTLGKHAADKMLLDDDELSTFFSDMEDDPFFSSEDEGGNNKQFRDLAEGKNLNNSFGGLTPDRWDHLHVDKGPNPQFFKQAKETNSPGIGSGAKKNSKPVMPKVTSTFFTEDG